MRVLIVTNTYPPADISGVGALAVELAEALHAEGHEPRVLTRAAAASDPFATVTGGAKLLFPLVAARRYLALAAGTRFDLVHVHESDGALVVLLVRLLRALRRPAGRPRIVATLQVSYRRERRAVRPVRAGGKVVSRPTGSERVFAWLRAPILSLLGRLTARLADAVVAPSRGTARELEEDYGARAVHVVPNGVALPAPAPAAAPDVGREGDGPVVLYAGRLRTRKAVAVLVEAFARVGVEHPGASLTLIGDGEQRPALEAQVLALGLPGRVRFAGTVARERMAEHYSACDVFCLPSTYEGFPVAILEAMAHGLPVVSTRVAGIPEAVEDGVTGLLVEPEDDAALAAALSRLLAEDKLRKDMGAAGRRRLEALFHRDRVGRAYLEVYEQACRRAKQAPAPEPP